MLPFRLPSVSALGAPTPPHRHRFAHVAPLFLTANRRSVRSPPVLSRFAFCSLRLTPRAAPCKWSFPVFCASILTFIQNIADCFHHSNGPISKRRESMAASPTRNQPLSRIRSNAKNRVVEHYAAISPYYHALCGEPLHHLYDV